MRPSSSRSELFAAVEARGGAAEATSDRAWLQALLDFEAGLARVQARAGVISQAEADAIAQACAADRFVPAEIGAAAAEIGNPAGPIVKALREIGPAHKGATSQDALDTAAMLVAKRALEPLLADLQAAAGAAARLAAEHRDTVMAGRTLLQQAVPITFGLKAAGWMTGLDTAAARLRAFRPAVQLGGAAGTGNPDVRAALASELGLDEPLLTWHTERTRIGELASGLAIAAGAAGKVARDITLLAQTEVARGARGRVRRLDGDAAQAESGRRDRRARVRVPSSRARGDPACLDGAGARARRGRLARRVEAAVGSPHPHRLRRRLAAHVARRTPGRRRAHARESHARRRPGRGRRTGRPRARPPHGGPDVIPHHIVTGVGKPLVLANSLGSNLHMWDGQAEALAEHFTLIRFDARGHGESDVPPGPYAIEDFGRDMIELLDHLQLESAHVAGISLGGMTAMWLAIHAPERVDRIIPTCTSAKLGPPQRWIDRANAVREGGVEAVAPAVAEGWVIDADRRPALEKMIASTPRDGYIASCAAIEHMDLLDDLHTITAPALVISGRQDPSAPPEHGQAIADRVPGARFEILDGAAHLANLERGDALVRLYLEHLR